MKIKRDNVNKVFRIVPTHSKYSIQVRDSGPGAGHGAAADDAPEFLELAVPWRSEPAGK